MKFLLIYFVFFFTTICVAQLPYIFIQTANIDNGGSALGVTVDSNGKIYLANSWDGLRIYSYDGSSFTNTIHINDGGITQDVAIGPDSTIFLANGNSGLWAYSYDGSYISNTSQIEDEDFANDLIVNSNGNIFLANGGAGLRAYRYDGNSFIVTADVDDGGRALGVAVGPDGTVFLANSYDGLRAYSYKDSSFINTAHIDDGGIAKGIAVGIDGTVFLANGIDGLRAYSYDGSSFTNTAHAEIDSGEICGVAVDSDGTIFSANNGFTGTTYSRPDDGLRAYIYNGSSFINTAHINDEGFAIGVALNSDGTVFLANGDEGLIAYTYSGYTDISNEISKSPVKYKLHQNYPNPFNPSTKIKYTLPIAEKVKIEVFNLLGQKIQTLLNKTMSTGSDEVEFIAKNLPSGVYLYRISAGEFQQVKKMVLMK